MYNSTPLKISDGGSGMGFDTSLYEGGRRGTKRSFEEYGKPHALLGKHR